jgi:hypothetical protein
LMTLLGSYYLRIKDVYSSPKGAVPGKV